MTKHITFGSLFRGIGGFDLGFENAGMSLEWSVEIDEDCNAVTTNVSFWIGKRIVSCLT
jgi:site-specific DNA-cytosine methylase